MICKLLERLSKDHVVDVRVTCSCFRLNVGLYKRGRASQTGYVFHTEHGNEDAQRTMGDTILNITVKEKDLGLTISADMKGNQIIGLIRRNIVYK